MSARTIPGSTTTRSLAALAAAAVCASGLTLLAPSSAIAASAAPAKPKQRDPISSKVKVVATPTGLALSGWVTDPDAPTANVTVSAVLDGKKTVASGRTTLANAGATARNPGAVTPAYALAVPVPAGKHIVCAVFNNLGGGLSVVKKCVTTPLGRTLTRAQKAKRSPRGAVTAVGTTAAAKGRSATVRLVGWASDPDIVSRRSKVLVYLNGQLAKTRTTSAFVGVRPAGAGASSRFDVTLPVASQTQQACVWVKNVGLGSNAFLGCRALDPRPGKAAAGQALPAVPVLNAKVLAVAKKQIGKPYVWAAAGPKSFDCSGLVTWAYKKYGYLTPRVAADQSRAARLIPASRVLPGDLVFYHDNTGDVYHVGIYIKPGLSVAAIDTAHGVNYQNIWNASAATYGSFTHL